MSKNKLNLLIDLLAYLGMVALVSTGLLLMYIMPPGTGGCHGEGGARVTLLSLSRHEWGTVHWYAAVALIVVASVHVILHWKWVTNTLGGLLKPSGATIARGGVRGPLSLVVLGLIGGAAIAAPWVIGTETHERGQGRARHRHGRRAVAKSCADCTTACPFSGLAEATAQATAEACKDPNCKECNPPEHGRTTDHQDASEASGHGQSIKGRTTLGEVAAMTGVPVSRLTEELKLPAGTSPQERLGHLRQQHGFSMQHVRDVVDRLRTTQGETKRED